MTVPILDPPSPLDTLDRWLEWRGYLTTLDQRDANVKRALETADRTIARIRRDPIFPEQL